MYGIAATQQVAQVTAKTKNVRPIAKTNNMRNNKNAEPKCSLQS